MEAALRVRLLPLCSELVIGVVAAEPRPIGKLEEKITRNCRFIVSCATIFSLRNYCITQFSTEKSPNTPEFYFLTTKRNHLLAYLNLFFCLLHNTYTVFIFSVDSKNIKNRVTYDSARGLIPEGMRVRCRQTPHYAG